tara:strand:- start:7394 stop:7606 length:213 start_codon:yes stop_codon:yes gene_type:complete
MSHNWNNFTLNEENNKIKEFYLSGNKVNIKNVNIKNENVNKENLNTKINNTRYAYYISIEEEEEIFNGEY